MSNKSSFSPVEITNMLSWNMKIVLNAKHEQLGLDRCQFDLDDYPSVVTDTINLSISEDRVDIFERFSVLHDLTYCTLTTEFIKIDDISRDDLISRIESLNSGRYKFSDNIIVIDDECGDEFMDFVADECLLNSASFCIYNDELWLCAYKRYYLHEVLCHLTETDMRSILLEPELIFYVKIDNLPTVDSYLEEFTKYEYGYDKEDLLDFLELVKTKFNIEESRALFYIWDWILSDNSLDLEGVSILDMHKWLANILGECEDRYIPIDFKIN